MTCKTFRWFPERNEELRRLYNELDTVPQVVDALKKLYPNERFTKAMVRKQAHTIGAVFRVRYRQRNATDREVHILMPRDLYASIRDESKRRKLSISHMTTLLLQNIAKDGLFNAVLDTEDSDHGHTETRNGVGRPGEP